MLQSSYKVDILLRGVPEISISPMLLPAMSPGNLVNLILVANVNVWMPDQSLMGVDYYTLSTDSGNNTHFSRPYCIVTLTHNALREWVTQANQYTITTG